MKKYILYSVAALALASCSNDILIDEIKNNETLEVGIGFSTFTDLVTKAENSGVTATHGLESYQTSFKVWGSKYIQGETPVVVFEGQDVLYSSSAWSYSPLRFWDKSAEKYDFYAAAPSNPTTAGWVWDNSSKKLSLADFEVDGETIAPSASIDAKAVLPNNKDIMISDDVTSYSTYTSDAVNLVFNHILSRFNIGIKKDATVLANYDVKLQSIEVFNMVKQASFYEANVADAATLKAGTTSRWTPANTPVRFTGGFGYKTVTEVTTDYNYVYQGLVIPQIASVETVALDGKAHAAVPAVQYADAAEYNAAKNTSLDDAAFDALSADEKIKIPAVAAIEAVGASSKPYIVISYKIYTKEVPAVNYADAAEYNSAKNTSHDDATFAALPAADKIKTPAVAAVEIGSYVYHYNLANIFNGTTTGAIAFNEGWQNTLNIIIKPAAIEFCPVVYEWDSTTPVEVEIPDSNGL